MLHKNNQFTANLITPITSANGSYRCGDVNPDDCLHLNNRFFHPHKTTDHKTVQKVRQIMVGQSGEVENGDIFNLYCPHCEFYSGLIAEQGFFANIIKTQ